MAMGIVDEKDFQKELESYTKKPVIPEVRIPKPEPTARVEEKKTTGWNGGRTEGAVEVPDVLRKVIGDTALESRNKNTDIARIFGVSTAATKAYKVGMTGPNGHISQDLKAHMRAKRMEVSDSAREKLMSALGYMTEEKLEGAKAKDLAGIAKDMSAVIRNMEPPEEAGDASQTNIIFYSPKPKEESDYLSIQVTE